MTREDLRTTLTEALFAAKSGKRLLARVHLEQVSELDPNNCDCWLWLAWTADSPDQAIECLEVAQEISPQHGLIGAYLEVARVMREYDTQTDYSKFLVTGPRTNSVTPSSAVKGTRDSVTDSDACDENETRITEDATDAAGREAQLDQWTTGAEVGQTIVADLVPDSPDTDDDHPGENSIGASLQVADEADSGDAGPAVATRAEENANVQERADDAASAAEEAAVRSLDSDAACDPCDDDVTEAKKVLEMTTAISATVAEYIGEQDQPEEPETQAPSKKTIDSGEDAPSEQQATPIILAVDDSPTVRKLVSMTLEASGYQVKTAANGVDAIRMLAQFKPALILLDVRMPRMDGYKLCKLIKGYEKTKCIPVVMLSGKDGVFDKLRGKLVGCNDYISKPFESADLVRHVARYVSGKTPSNQD